MLRRWSGSRLRSCNDPGDAILQDWSSQPTHLTFADATTIYTIESRCSVDTACVDHRTLTVVLPGSFNEEVRPDASRGSARGRKR